MTVPEKMKFAVLSQPDQLATQVNRSRHFPGTGVQDFHKFHSLYNPLTWHGLLHYAVLMTFYMTYFLSICKAYIR